MRSPIRSGLVAFVVMLGLGLAPACAQKAPPDPAGVTAALELMEVVGVSQQLDGMIRAMGQGMQQGAADAGDPARGAALKADFDAFMKRFLNYKPAMLKDFAALYAERFTVEELKAVTAFYRSGPGAKFVKVTPELMQEGSQIGIKYAQKVNQEVAAERAGKK